jgi:signal transduction histidine kinase
MLAHLGNENQPVGLLVHMSAPTSEVPARVVDTDTTDELRDVNERLVLAGLKAQEQAELEITLRGEAEAALAIRDEFISVAAHELRTPVTAIKASAQLALRRLADATPDKEHRAVSTRHCGRC